MGTRGIDWFRSIWYPILLRLFFLSICSCGFLLALVFGLGDDAVTRPDFWKLQVTATRNIIGGNGILKIFYHGFAMDNILE